MEQPRQVVAVWAIVALGVALRAWLAVEDHSVFWPDEIHQSLEQAHRAVFGYGLLPWEFRDGARSWVFPGSIAALWKLAGALGVDSSLGLVNLARLAMVLASGAGIAFAAKLAAQRGARAGLAAAVVLATLPPAVALGYRTMSETASAPLIALGAWLWSRRERRSALYAGLALATACLFRYQNGVFLIVFGVALLLGRRWRDAVAYAAAGAGVAVFGGALDWVTWGRPFHSLLAYVDFNLVLGGAASFGVEPFSFYATSLWSSTGPLLLVLGACFSVGAFVEPVLGGAVLAYVLAHSVLPHKELRFLAPCFPLLSAVIGVGVERILHRVPAPRLIASASALAVTLGFGAVLAQLRYQDMGQYLGTERAALPVWNSEEEPSLLLAEAGERPDLCGVAVLQARAAFTGGYTYLHRDVPLIYENELCSAAPANYVIGPVQQAARLLPATYTLQRQLGPWGLYRRDGACRTPDGFDYMLEGARDMGLARQRPQQASDGALRVDLARDSGAFAYGWGHGERIDCETARWVSGKRAVIELDFEPGSTLYELVLRARAHELSTPQRFAVTINDERVHVGAMAAQLQTYRAPIPEHALRPGKNRIELAFAKATRAGGDDLRELAALFRVIEIVPLQDDFRVDVAAPDAVDHLVSGFFPSERAGDTTFVWSDGPSSVVEGTIAWPRSPYVLTTVAEAVPLVPSQRTRVLVNDQLVGSIRFSQGWSSARLVIPAPVLRKGRNRVRFEYEATARPAALERGATDQRELAVRFRSIELAAMAGARDLDFGVPAARPFMLDGWSGDERDGERSVVWSDGPRASAVLSFEGLQRPVLRMSAQGYTHALPIQVNLLLDGKAVAAFAAPDGWQELAIPITGADPLAKGTLVTFELDRTGRPAQRSPNSRDERELGLRVDRVWVDAQEEGGLDAAVRALRPAGDDGNVVASPAHE